jgi:hypothetical protein
MPIGKACNPSVSCNVWFYRTAQAIEVPLE